MPHDRDCVPAGLAVLDRPAQLLLMYVTRYSVPVVRIALQRHGRISAGWQRVTLHLCAANESGAGQTFNAGALGA